MKHVIFAAILTAILLGVSTSAQAWWGPCNWSGNGGFGFNMSFGGGWDYYNPYWGGYYPYGAYPYYGGYSYGAPPPYGGYPYAARPATPLAPATSASK